MDNDLRFAGTNPVIINYNGNVDDIYAPVKTSSCDVNIVSEKILDDLYSPRKDGIYVNITKRVPHKVKSAYLIDGGYCAGVWSDNNLEQSHTYVGKKQFYVDVYGAFRFTGTVKSTLGGIERYQNLLYSPAEGGIQPQENGSVIWVENNNWLLEDGEFYFYDQDGNSYKTWEDEEHIFFISKWGRHYDSQSGFYYTGWGEPEEYMRSNGEYFVYCSYPNDDICHYIDGHIELLYGNERYQWNGTNMEWVRLSPYRCTLSTVGYNGLYGHNYMKVKTKNGDIVDACIAREVTGTGVWDGAWLVALNHASNTFDLLIPITKTSRFENTFTGDNGDVYIMEDSGKIFYWSWLYKGWVLWCTITGDIEDDTSFYLDYIIPTTVTWGTYKGVVFKYDETKFFAITSIMEPVVDLKWLPVPGEYDYITWEGYKMPNTFSQDVTLNLDEIGMTCIDPVSMLKYVKINKIMTRPAMVTYREIIGSALAYVMLTGNKLKVERNVTYGSGIHTVTNNILNMMCQISNFWDEGDNPSTLYDVIQELLRPFCLTLEYVNNTYWIFNQTRTEDDSTYDEYIIEANGELTLVETNSIEPEVFELNEGDWISNNISNATIEIGSTYNRVTAVASTSIPKYSNMVTDQVDYSNRDKYEIGQVNVQRNKTKGFMVMPVAGTAYRRVQKNPADYWFYLWNGVYTDEDYELISYNMLVNGWLNINKAYEYLEETTGHPNDYGSILNFYGGANNPSATGKEQDREKPVEVKSRITAYAPDNGVPPEFLEEDDLWWLFKSNYDLDDRGYDPILVKANKTSSAFGSDVQPSGTHRTVYHQVYANTVLNGLNSQTLEIRMSQSYSRTGIDVPISVLNNNSAYNNNFYMELNSDDGNVYYDPIIKQSDTSYFPQPWNWDSVMVDDIYFNRYATGHNKRITPVWDRRRIDVYIQVSGGVLQFNGKEWVEDTAFNPSNSFYLLKLMNYEQLFHKDYNYNVIETSDGNHYSLTDENFSYNVDTHGGVVQNPTSFNRYCTPYKAEENDWTQWINDCGEGYLSLNLPTVEAGVADVVVDITNSSLLGSTGGSVMNNTKFVPFYFEYIGLGEITEEGVTHDVVLSPDNIGNKYGTIGYCPGMGSKMDFIPNNVTYVKGEHLDLSISIDVPESNLGQMFSQSDIKYIINNNENYDEEYVMNDFKENTYNQLVNDSFSYLLFENDRAYAEQFFINNLEVRPECYTVQAYMNWLSKIRKIYTKTLLPLRYSPRQFTNFKDFITSSEVGDNKLMVVSDSWDLKTDRHTVTAIEAQDLEVYEVDAYTVQELPRKARNERWNLPTVSRK
jgi:hypothetical protein